MKKQTSYKVAYVSSQSSAKDKDFDGHPPISYAGITFENYPIDNSVESITKFYNKDHVHNGFFELLKESNIIVCFHSYNISLLDKYNKIEKSINSDFSVIPIWEVIKNEIGSNVYLKTLGNAIGIPRKVNSGNDFIDLYNKRKYKEIKEFMLEDIKIVKKSFDLMMKGEVIKLTSPTNKIVNMQTSFFKDYIDVVSKETFNHRMFMILDKVRDYNKEMNKGINSESFNEHHINYLVDKGDLAFYNKCESKFLYDPKKYTVI